MSALLSPKLWGVVAVTIALSASHFAAYRSGRAAIQARWNEAKLAQAELDRKGAEQTRAAERRQAVDVIGAINEAKAREHKAMAAAAGARLERDRLRDDLADAQRDLPSAPPSACIERANTLSGLLDQCAAAYQELAGQADRHAGDALMLQRAWPKSSQP